MLMDYYYHHDDTEWFEREAERSDFHNCQLSSCFTARIISVGSLAQVFICRLNNRLSARLLEATTAFLYGSRCVFNSERVKLCSK